MSSGIGRQPRILILADQFTPSRRGGGPVTSIVNLIKSLGEEFAFHVATRDRDLGAAAPYPGLPSDQWLDAEGHRVLYRASRLWHIATPDDPQAIAPDLVYLNSFFSPATTLPYLAWRRVNRGRAVPTLLAPRGGLADAALRIKSWKKRPVLGLAKSLGLYEGLHWQATSVEEAVDIAARTAAFRDRVYLVPNVATDGPVRAFWRPREGGEPYRIAFVSRISRKKNLDFALHRLNEMDQPVVMDIYGPPEDTAYWQSCVEIARNLPSTVQIKWKGGLKPEAVRTALAASDLLFLPTQNENYGHVIAEALSVGTPVLISDQTPWRNLEGSGAGFDLPLDAPQKFVEAIRVLASEDAAASGLRRKRVLAYWQAQSGLGDAVEAHRQMFNSVLRRSGR